MTEKTFRVFISSTFSDFKAERNALQKQVFAPLRQFCTRHGARFQAVDLRWGISREASRDQRTVAICLAEIARCQQITPRPNFILLLGDRYGWCPPPARIPQTEFETLCAVIPTDDLPLVKNWYRLDLNARPPEFVLQSWEKLDYDDWLKIEARLHAILEKAAHQAKLPEAAAFKYWASATHQEAALGAFSVQAEPEHVFAFFRELESLPDPKAGKDFLDVVTTEESPQVDAVARKKLDSFKADLRAALPEENIHTDTVPWAGDAPSQSAIDRFCQVMLAQLKGLIRAQLAQMADQDPLEAEIAAQAAFARERSVSFTGRGDLLGKIAAHLRQRTAGALAIWGQPGAGKSALLAQAFLLAQDSLPQNAVLAARFVGASPESTTPRALVTSLCRQLARAYDAEEKEPPAADGELAAFFEAHLALASSAKPLILFIDALDQLPGDLSWLPARLPAGVHLALSTLAGAPRARLADRLPGAVFHELHPLAQGEAADLLESWLDDLAGRNLQKDQKTVVLQNTTPLYLRLAFEAARRWHSYDPVPSLPDTVDGLIGALFDQLSAEDQHGGPLVARALGYLAAAKNGLAEDELLDLLSRDLLVYSWFLRSLFHIPPDLLDWVQNSQGVSADEAERWLRNLIRHKLDLELFLEVLLAKNPDLRLPVVLWSRLYADLAPYLAVRQRDGARLLTFYHPTSFGKAVRARYLDGEDKLARHQTLAAYFAAQPLDLQAGGDNLRKLSELPFQQAHGHLWPQVAATLLDLPFLRAKVRSAGAPALIDDLQRPVDLGHEDPALDALRKALNLALFALHKDPDLLSSQLYGRLQGVTLPPVEKLLAQIESDPGVWLKPRFPCLTPALSPLQVTVPVGELVEHVALSPDARWLAALNVDSMATVWDCQTGARVYSAEFEEYLDHDDTIAISDGGRYFLMVLQPDFDSPYPDETLIVYDLETGRKLLPDLAEVGGLGYSVDPETGYIAPDWPHRHVAKTQHWARVTPRGGKPTRVHFGAPCDDVFTDSLDGRFGVEPVSDTAVGLFDRSITGDLPPLTREADGIWTLAISPDGALAAVLGKGVSLWDMASGNRVAHFDLHGTQMAFSASGRWLACLHAHQLSLIDLEQMRLVYQKKLDLSITRDLVITPDEKRILAALGTARVCVWDLQTGEALPDILSGQGVVFHMALTPDGHAAAVAYHDSSVHIWDLEGDGEWPPFEPNLMIDALVISPDGALTALCGRTGIFVGEAKTGRTRMRVDRVKRGAMLDFAHLALHPSGARLATAGTDHRLVVWDVALGEPLAAFTGEEAFSCCALSPDGLTVVGGGESGTLAFLSLENALPLAGTISKADREAAEAMQEESCPPDFQAQIQQFYELLKSGRYGEALEVLDGALADGPDQPALQMLRAGPLIELGRHAEALAVTTSLLEKGGLPEEVVGSLYQFHGLSQMGLGQNQAALESLLESLRQIDSDDIRLRVGYLQIDLDQPAAAEANFLVLEKKGFPAPGVLFGMALALASQGRGREACPYLRRFLALDDPRVDQARTQAEALLAQLCD